MLTIKQSQVSSMPRRDLRGFVPSPVQLKVFDELVQIIKPYQKLMNARVNTEVSYELWTKPLLRVSALNKKGRDYAGVLFAGVMIRKKYVGLYVYALAMSNSLKASIREKSIGANLHGLSALHFKMSVTEEVKFELKELLDTCFDLYKQEGWVK